MRASRFFWFFFNINPAFQWTKYRKNYKNFLLHCVPGNTGICFLCWLLVVFPSVWLCMVFWSLSIFCRRTYRADFILLRQHQWLCLPERSDCIAEHSNIICGVSWVFCQIYAYFYNRHEYLFLKSEAYWGGLYSPGRSDDFGYFWRCTGGIYHRFLSKAWRFSRRVRYIGNCTEKTFGNSNWLSV